MGPESRQSNKGSRMAENVDPVFEEAHAPELQKHVRDYSRFIQMLKWGAIVSFVTAILVLFIIT
jgi:hypothetical protein